MGAEVSYPWKTSYIALSNGEGFTVQINLSQAAVDEAQMMRLGEHVQEAIARATPYPEGRWIFIPVRSADDIPAIQQLLALRVGPKRPQKEH